MFSKNKPVDKAVEYYNEWKTWRENLRPYWTQIDKNQEMYEFYKREDEESSSSVSLNTPFAIVESLVAKCNENNLEVNVKAKGKNEKGINDFEDWVSSILEDAIMDADVASIVGSFKKTKEKYEREYFIKGNAFAEINWLKKKDGNEVLANGPFVRVLPFKSVIFNPAKTASDSNVYYIEKYVSWRELEEKEQDKTGRGLYKNLYKLKRSLTKDDQAIDHEEDQFVSADKKITRKVSKIQLLERWEGTKLCVIADGSVIIREDDDPLKIGRCPILVSMNYVVTGRPYAYGEIDAIYKPVRAQDTIINQNIQILNRYLKDALVVDVNSGVELDDLMLILEDGGVVYGTQNAIMTVPTNVPPQSAFTAPSVLQEAIERAARFSPYSTGIPAQKTDKTMGTMGGIQALQRASEPNFQIKLDDIEDTFMRPLGRIYLRMIANLMGEKDIRYALLKNKTSQWVAATKGILQGKAKVEDMIICGMITPEQGIEVAIELADQGKDPREHIVFDVDWVVDIRLDNQAEVDKIQKANQKMGFVGWASKTLGIQFSPERTATDIGRGMGIEDPEALYLTEEEKQELAQKQQAMMEAEQQNQIQQEAMKSQMQDQSKTKQKLLDHKSRLSLEQLKQAGAPMGTNVPQPMPPM
jgi:hypothetical protein